MLSLRPVSTTFIPDDDIINIETGRNDNKRLFFNNDSTYEDLNEHVDYSAAKSDSLDNTLHSDIEMPQKVDEESVNHGRTDQEENAQFLLTDNPHDHTDLNEHVDLSSSKNVSFPTPNLHEPTQALDSQNKRSEHLSSDDARFHSASRYATAG